MEAGTRDKKHDSPGPAGRGFLAAGRFVGFAVLAGISLSILATVVLLPAYVSMSEAGYQRDILAARQRNALKLIDARERMIKALQEDDRQLLTRLVRSQFDLLPRNEVVVIDPSAPPQTPQVYLLAESPLPSAHKGLISHAADKLKNDRTRRGLLLLSAGAMLAAMFLFSPPKISNKPDTATNGDES